MCDDSYQTSTNDYIFAMNHFCLQALLQNPEKMFSGIGVSFKNTSEKRLFIIETKSTIKECEFSNADVIAKFAIWTSLNPAAETEAFLIIDLFWS